MKNKQKLSALLAALISGIALFVFTTCEQGAGGTSENNPPPSPPGEETEDPPIQTGIAVDYSDTIFIYARNQPFDSNGLIVRKVGTKGEEAWEEVTNDYTLAFPGSLTKETVTGTPGLKIITITSGKFSDSYNIQVTNSDKILQSITITNPPSSTVYEIGQNPDFTGMVVSAVYTGASGTETKPLSTYTYTGYDKLRRGTQTITIKANQKAAPIDVRVKVPANAEITVNSAPVEMGAGSPGNHRQWYRAALIKGRPLPNGDFPDDIKITVTANGTKAIFTKENGGLDGAIISNFNQNQAGSQTLTCTVDDASITFRVYVIDVEPHIFFDYGYWRHSGNPDGGATVTGGTPAQYTVPVNTELVITPVVFSMNTETPSYSWQVLSSAGAYTSSMSGMNNKFFKITPSAVGNYTVKVTVNAGSATGMTATTTIVCTPARPASQPAAVSNPAFSSPLPPIMNGGNTNTGPYIRNFAPGQFTKSGTGYGWSLGTIGGYFVWKLQKQADGNIRIVGNPFGGWSESGIVWVSADDNHNGLPDDTWYELKGSHDVTPHDSSPVTRSYGIRFALAPSTGFTNEYGQLCQEVYWIDCKGRAGRIPGGWPTDWGVAETDNAWVEFAATHLRDNGHIDDDSGYNGVFAWGYVDSMNYGAAPNREYDRFYLSDAIRADGTPANLPYIDFVRVQNALFYYGGIFGEYSTEINWGEGLGSMTNFPSP